MASVRPTLSGVGSIKVFVSVGRRSCGAVGRLHAALANLTVQFNFDCLLLGGEVCLEKQVWHRRFAKLVPLQKMEVLCWKIADWLGVWIDGWT